MSVQSGRRYEMGTPVGLFKFGQTPQAVSKPMKAKPTQPVDHVPSRPDLIRAPSAAGHAPPAPPAAGLVPLLHLEWAN